MALKDSENLKLIEALRPRTAKLKERKILNDADLQRHDRTVREALEHATKQFGTADLDQLRLKIAADYETNTNDRSQYEALIESVERELALIDAEVQ
jgi:hypothetical protein